MEKVTLMDEQRDRRMQMAEQMVIFGAVTLFMALYMINPALCTDAARSDVKDILDQMVDVIGMVFQAVGIILSVYSVAQLVLAIKNEDPDSKTKASTQLVVGIVLIALPPIIDGLGLVERITKTS